MSRVDLQAVTTIIQETAQAVILPRFRNLESQDIREKQPGDYVTIADTEAEAILTQRLTDLLPGSLVVGEEAVAADDHILDRLSGDVPVWIIDPVDGTANFAKGHEKFAVIVALAVKGQTIAGWIHSPVEGQMAVGECGGGAFLGDHRLSLPADVPFHEMRGTGGKPARLACEVRTVYRNGSAAHDYLDLLEGRSQFAHYLRLKPWDHAAGVLMHLEAGGYSALCDGQAYRPTLRAGHLLMAPNRDAWSRLRSLITC